MLALTGGVVEASTIAFRHFSQVKLLLEEAEKKRKADEAASHLLNVSRPFYYCSIAYSVLDCGTHVHGEVLWQGQV